MTARVPARKQHGNGQIPTVHRMKKKTDSIRESCRDKQAFTGRLEITRAATPANNEKNKQWKPFCIQHSVCFSHPDAFFAIFLLFYASLAATMSNDTLSPRPSSCEMFLIFELCQKISFSLICFRIRQEHNHIQFQMLSQS